MTYDEWKQMNPEDLELENECFHCGTPCKETYCSKRCKNYDTE